MTSCWLTNISFLCILDHLMQPASLQCLDGTQIDWLLLSSTLPSLLAFCLWWFWSSILRYCVWSVSQCAQHVTCGREGSCIFVVLLLRKPLTKLLFSWFPSLWLSLSVMWKNVTGIHWNSTLSLMVSSAARWNHVEALVDLLEWAHVAELVCPTRSCDRGLTCTFNLGYKYLSRTSTSKHAWFIGNNIWTHTSWMTCCSQSNFFKCHFCRPCIPNQLPFLDIQPIFQVWRQSCMCNCFSWFLKNAKCMLNVVTSGVQVCPSHHSQINKCSSC